MPELGSWAWLSWLACIAGEITVSGFMAYSGTWRKYPSVFAYVCWKSLLSLLLLGIVVAGGDESWRNFLYFYVYYFGAMVSCILSFSIICTFVTSFVDSVEMRESLKTALRIAGVAFALGSLFFSAFTAEPYDPFNEGIVRFAACLNRGVILGTVILFLCSVYVVRWLKLSWPQGSKGLAGGFALLQIGGLAYWLLDSVGVKQFVGCIAEVFAVACFVTWILTLRSAVPFPERLCPASTLEG